MPQCAACVTEPEPPVRVPHTVYVKSLYRVGGQDYCRHHIIKAAVAAGVITDRLRERDVKLALGRALYDPGDPWESCSSISSPPSPSSKPISSACAPARAWPSPSQREIARQAAQTVRPTAAGTLPHACHRRVFHQRSRRTLLRLKTNRLSHTQPAPFPLAYDPAPYRNRPDVVPLPTQCAHGVPPKRRN